MTQPFQRDVSADPAGDRRRAEGLREKLDGADASDELQQLGELAELPACARRL
jgi:hypothetical protein